MLLTSVRAGVAQGIAQYVVFRELNSHDLWYVIADTVVTVLMAAEVTIRYLASREVSCASLDPASPPHDGTWRAAVLELVFERGGLHHLRAVRGRAVRLLPGSADSRLWSDGTAEP